MKLKLNKYITVGVIILAVALIIGLSQNIREHMTGGQVLQFQADEDRTLNAQAPAGTIFGEVVFASYGTPTKGVNTIPTCHAARSWEVVEETCLGKSSCSIVVSNNTFDNPCGNTPKNLYVALKTVPEGTVVTPSYRRVAEANEGAFAKLKAPPDSRITDVTFVSYGTPTIGNDGLPKRSNCHADIPWVKAGAVGKTEYNEVMAHNNYATFDPCHGTYKKLMIGYKVAPTVDPALKSPDIEYQASSEVKGTMTLQAMQPGSTITEIKWASMGNSKFKANGTLEEGDCTLIDLLDKATNECVGKTKCSFSYEGVMRGSIDQNALRISDHFGATGRLIDQMDLCKDKGGSRLTAIYKVSDPRPRPAVRNTTPAATPTPATAPPATAPPATAPPATAPPATAPPATTPPATAPPATTPPATPAPANANTPSTPAPATAPPADTKKDETKKDETKKDETKKDETKKDETKKDETKKDETEKDETKKDETKKDETEKDDGKTNSYIMYGIIALLGVIVIGLVISMSGQSPQPVVIAGRRRRS